MSLQTKLQGLVDGKTAVVNSINAKASTSLTVTSKWSDLASAVDGITAGGGGEGSITEGVQAVITARGATAGDQLFRNTETADFSFLEGVDFSANTTCIYMFAGSSWNKPSKAAIVPYFDTSNVTNMNYMFQQTQYLQSIPVPFYNTDKVTSITSLLSTSNDYGPLVINEQFTLNLPECTTINGAFNGRKYIKHIKLTNTVKLNDLNTAFTNCSSLEILDFDTLDAVTSSSSFSGLYQMCTSCSSLKKFIIRNATVVPPCQSSTFTSCYHLLGTINSTYNPEGLKDGRIYVPDAMVDSFKAATNWSTFADIIVPLSTLVE